MPRASTSRSCVSPVWPADHACKPHRLYLALAWPWFLAGVPDDVFSRGASSSFWAAGDRDLGRSFDDCAVLPRESWASPGGRCTGPVGVRAEIRVGWQDQFEVVHEYVGDSWQRRARDSGFAYERFAVASRSSRHRSRGQSPVGEFAPPYETKYAGPVKVPETSGVLVRATPTSSRGGTRPGFCFERRDSARLLQRVRRGGEASLAVRSHLPGDVSVDGSVIFTYRLVPSSFVCLRGGGHRECGGEREPAALPAWKRRRGRGWCFECSPGVLVTCSRWQLLGLGHEVGPGRT